MPSGTVHWSTVHWSDSVLLRQSIGPTDHWSDSPLVRQIYWIVIIGLKYVIWKPFPYVSYEVLIHFRWILQSKWTFGPMGLNIVWLGQSHCSDEHCFDDHCFNDDCSDGYFSRFANCWSQIKQPCIIFTHLKLRCMSPWQHQTMSQYWFNVGPPSATLVQHQSSIGSMSGVSWDTLKKIQC